MFGKKTKESDKVVGNELNEPIFNWGISESKEAPLFKSLKSLIYEAESQFEAGEFELCNDILSVVIRHIKRNKFIAKQIITQEDLINLKNEENE